jgi:hypothetical protein
MAHEPVYRHFLDKLDTGRFSSLHKDVQTLVDFVLDERLGCPVASSYSGIGADITNGFVQFIVDNPVQFHDLTIALVEIMDRFEQRERPCINVRSKSLPREFVTPRDQQFITIMFRTPKLRDRKHAEAWWAKLAGHVQSYSSQR